MIRRDYIMTMIEQMARLLAQIILIKERVKPSQVAEALDRAGHLFFGFDLKILTHLGEEEFLAALRTGDTIDPAKCAIVALLLTEQADAFHNQGKDEESYPRYMKALAALLQLHRAGMIEGLPENVPTVERVAGKLEAFDLPAEPRLKLFNYFQSTGAYARAEDILCSLENAEDAPAELTSIKLEFYQMLLTRTDAALIAGGLPRDEVEEGLAAVREQETARKAS